MLYEVVNIVVAAATILFIFKESPLKIILYIYEKRLYFVCFYYCARIYLYYSKMVTFYNYLNRSYYDQRVSLIIIHTGIIKFTNIMYKCV